MSESIQKSAPRASSGDAAIAAARAFEGLLDVWLPVTVILGTSTITVRRCLQLQRDSVLKLDQSAGADLTVLVNGVRIARGEVVIVEDGIAVRLTTFSKPGKETAA